MMGESSVFAVHHAQRNWSVALNGKLLQLPTPHTTVNHFRMGKVNFFLEVQNSNPFTSLNLRHLQLVLKSTSSLKTESLWPCTRRLHRLTFILASISVSSPIFLDDDPGETPNGFKNILKISSHAFHTLWLKMMCARART